MASPTPQQPPRWKVVVAGTVLYAWGTMPHRIQRFIARLKGSAFFKFFGRFFMSFGCGVRVINGHR
eukprot:1391122-Amorphochlora_amoeboformis.AAC.1